ncbi:MAG: MFS transporter [Alphaproteobacteria bacterium]|nr:MFS transporter [Alphaproteobacteria bacterium]
MKAFWRSPVYILFAATAIVLIANGSRQSFGLFLEPISTDLKWGVTEFATAIAIQNLIMGIAAPFTGALADRWMRPTTVIALAAGLYATGVALISVSVTPGTMYLSAGLIVGIGASGVGLTLPLGIVGRVAPEKSRTFWLGIVTAGGSAGQFAFALTSKGLIDGFGWAGGIVILALIVAVAVPLAWSMRSAGAVAFSKPDTETLGSALKRASHHRGYWLLVIGFFVCGFQVQFVGTHLPKFLTDSGAGAYRRLGGRAVAQAEPAEPALSCPGPAVSRVSVPAGERDHGHRLQCDSRAAVAVDGAVDQRNRRAGVRPPLYEHAVRHRFSEPPAGSVFGRVPGRAVLRHVRDLRRRLVAGDLAVRGGGSYSLVHRRPPRRGAGPRTRFLIR